jgi:uncharacterized protein YbjT (DUF2867 family)/uncharacterized membrane protein YphA (DoxX/SURF4 family)
MRILLTGATGFIGRHLAAALEHEGHTVVRASRSHGSLSVDFSRDIDSSAWIPRLQGIDAVINAVGILREHGEQTFEALHDQAPKALFRACALIGVPRVIQISALGADEHAASQYHLSKRRADLALAALPVNWTIVQPSLVFGTDGESARFFATLASLPLIPLPGDGAQPIQPIHIDDLVAAMLAILRDTSTYQRVIPLVGPQPVSLRGYLADLRSALAYGRAHWIAVPMPLVRAVSAIGDVIPGGLLNRESLGMLVRGNTGDPSAVTALLGREPRNPREFIPADQRESLRLSGQLAWLLPLLRLSIALVWIFTGIVSLGLYPPESSYQLLARSGVPMALAPLFLYGAALLDLLLGVATLVARRRRLLWIAQAVLILGYTVIITVRMPEFWLHPYGPLLKNLPMLAVLYLLYRFEPR